MSGGFQSVPSSPFSIVPVSGLHHYPYPVQQLQQNPVMVMSSPQVQFPVQIQQAQSQFPQSQAIPLTSQFGQSMVLIPIDFGQQQQQSFLSSQYPQNVISGSVPTPPSSSGSGKNSESTVTEQPQTCFCPTETLNQTHGGFFPNGGGYYLLEPVSNFQPDQNPAEQIGNLQESVSSTSTTNPSCQCQLCSGRLPSAPSSSSSVSVDTSSNGLGSIQQSYSLPVSSWNFPLQPTPVYQYVIYPVQPTPLQFPSVPMSNFDGNFENFYRSSSHRQDAAWSKMKKNPQAATPPKPMCGFCKSNREPKEVYRGHWLRNDAGDLICPSLRKYVCPVCGATGDNAHTIKYCPQSPPSSNPTESESSTKEIKDDNKEN